VTLVVGVLAALAAAVAYSAGVTLQAIEARLTPDSVSLRPSLLGHLATKRRWLLGTACVVAGWFLQALALLLAPITVVQPALAVSVVTLLYIGCRWFGQSARRKEVWCAVAIVAGVGGLVAVAPAGRESEAAPLALTLGLTALGLVALAPLLLRGSRRAGGLIVLSAGLAYAWCGFSTKLLADGVSSGAWPVAAAWFAATAVAAGVGLLSEMTALRERAAIRVFPVVLVVQIVVAVLLAPLLAGERWSPDPLVLVGLGVSLAVVAGATRLLADAAAIEAAIAGRDASRGS